MARNLQSVLAEPSVVLKLLLTETNKGYVVGPFSSPPFLPYHINSIGIATHKYLCVEKANFCSMSSPHSNSWASFNERPILPALRFRRQCH